VTAFSRCGEGADDATIIFLKDEAGAPAIEYAIISGGISIVIVVAVQAIGTTLNTTFTSVAAGLK
jgi:pilus assembly protein Flp/PilA